MVMDPISLHQFNDPTDYDLPVKNLENAPAFLRKYPRKATQQDRNVLITLNGYNDLMDLLWNLHERIDALEYCIAELNENDGLDKR